jgi:hypothetical protein
MRDWDGMVDRTMRAAERAFGRPVTFRTFAPLGSGDDPPDPVTIRAVFDEAFRSVDTSSAVPVSTTSPIVDVRASDLPWTPEQGDTVEVNGATYTVVDVQPDGAGTNRLFLRSGTLGRL